jgi:hypothetical protein
MIIVASAQSRRRFPAQGRCHVDAATKRWAASISCDVI